MTETERRLLRKVIADTENIDTLRLIANYLMNGIECDWCEENQIELDEKTNKDNDNTERTGLLT